jgi:beta-lactamase superfamily II metal-dependent hydrolase
MDGQLLVRLYNVGLGDCIYLRVPDLHQEVHILIDCGNKFSPLKLLGERIAELKADLPDAGGGKKRLDLLVVSHPHEDHHKGFEEEFFEGIQIERIWLSPAFDRLNPKAQGFHALKEAAQRALTSLSAFAAGDMKEEVDELLSLSKKEAVDLLCKGLNKGIKPLYVTADTPPEQLKIFDDPNVQLKVLGPMGEIDRYYLGGQGLVSAPDDNSLQGMAEGYQALFPPQQTDRLQVPKNISWQDFQKLRSRIRANGLAAAALAGHAENNLSVVLLLEWHGRRLLFPGDAEWSGKHDIRVKPGKSNSSWNVMWQERQADLEKPLDFLKIGHHGSENATPWAPTGTDGKVPAINQILDALLPVPTAGKRPQGKAIASTERTTRWVSIPDPALMQELGRRVANARITYVEDPSRLHVPPRKRQPQRTDLEAQVKKKPVPYIQLTFKPR